MNLDRLSGEDWLLRLSGHQIVLSGDELDKLAELVAFRLGNYGLVSESGVSLALSEDLKRTVHLCFTDEIPELIGELKEFMPEYMKEASK